ncbi:MAG: hypothetical protein R3241_00020 [Rheinheimera sp.]|nr:hypothetical protein [Rheinheimera sp.]
MDNKQQHKDISRRRFLQKTTVGAVIASLPAKSVWGACSVSGALSGNLSQNTDRHDCTIPRLFGGRSPGGWLNIEDNCHSIFTQLGQMKQRFGKNSKKYKDAHNCYMSAVDLVMAHNLPLPAQLTTVTHTVRSGLATNGYGGNNIFFHLAAVYLNAYFGLYGQYHYGPAAAVALTEQVFLSWYRVINQDQNMVLTFSDSELGYTDGSTDWKASC